MEERSVCENLISKVISLSNSASFSPKDATLSGNKVLTLYNQQIQNKVVDSNQKVIEYMKASGKALQVKNGKKQVSFLTYWKEEKLLSC